MAKKDVGFYFYYGKEIYQLPVNPEKITIKNQGNNKVEESVSLGDISILKRRKLSEISFESFFPGDGNTFPGVRTKNKFLNPSYYKVFFDKLQKYGKTCKLTVTGLSVVINMVVSVESFEYDIRAGEHEDVYFSITLKEYKDFSIKEIPISDKLRRITGATTTTKPSTKTPKSNSGVVLQPKAVTKGCTVMLTGRVCTTIYGDKPGKTFKNYKCKVNIVNDKGTHPYHVTTLDGGWLGWVRKSEVTVV